VIGLVVCLLLQRASQAVKVAFLMCDDSDSTDRKSVSRRAIPLFSRF